MSGPAIETWWPELSIGARHALNDALAEERNPHLPESVRAEIESITGNTRDADDAVSDDEREFIETQQEQVD
ncbi:hypothetical protein [Microcella alkaliphila]|uniref:Transposase n=1 Tax=Microcella alkaliphila TaxID=279828 RepID=A0A0U5B8C1_9MICO|nr:hypothetical protein [Microcella alkaliphila]BAU32100.1 transposase [Microcella alkaliphila]